MLRAKAAELVAIDDEVRAITEALGEGHGLPQLTASGLVATCTACGGIMGVRDRHCPSCGAAAGEQAEDGLGRPPLEEPTYEDEEIAVHQAVDGYEEDVPFAQDEESDDLEAGEPAHQDDDDPVALGGNGASPPPWGEQSRRSQADPPQRPRHREALVPLAQRTFRAGRRLARNWIEERRASGR